MYKNSTSSHWRRDKKPILTNSTINKESKKIEVVKFKNYTMDHLDM